MRDRVQAAAERRDTLIVTVIAGCSLAIVGTALYVAAHFIAKFW